MEEYVDVLDKDGNPTGISKLKSEIHRDGDWHRSVHVWIINPNGELLIQKRSKSKINYPDLWDISAAGHISAGENSIIAGLREAEEELGIKLTEGNLEYLFTQIHRDILDSGKYIDNEFNDVYLVKFDFDLSKLRIQKEEVQEVKSLHFKDLERIVQTKDKSFCPHPEIYPKLFVEFHKRFK